MNGAQRVLVGISLLAANAAAYAETLTEVCNFELLDPISGDPISGKITISQTAPHKYAANVKLGQTPGASVQIDGFKLAQKLTEQQKNDPDFIEMMSEAGGDAKLVAARNYFAVRQTRKQIGMTLNIWLDAAGKKLVTTGNFGSAPIFCKKG